MTLQAWWIFVCATFVVSAMPGPNMLHVMTQAMRYGIGNAMFTMAGCMAALLLMFGLSALGMGALLTALPQLLDAIKIVGAAYLIWVGIRAWRDRGAPIDIGEGEVDAVARSPVQLVRGGFLISISNPKALIFAAAFFPQFISPDAAKVPQFAMLLATFALIETAWYFAYATGGRTLVPYLQRGECQRMFNRITGGLFVVFGLSLFAWRR